MAPAHLLQCCLLRMPQPLCRSRMLLQAVEQGTVSGWQALAAQVLDEVSQDADMSTGVAASVKSTGNDASQTARTRPR